MQLHAQGDLKMKKERLNSGNVFMKKNYLAYHFQIVTFIFKIIKRSKKYFDACVATFQKGGANPFMRQKQKRTISILVRVTSGMIIFSKGISMNICLIRAHIIIKCI